MGHPVLFIRQAVIGAVVRQSSYFLQDPLIEFSQLCGAEKDILCLRYHPLQDLLSEDELLDGNMFFNVFVLVGFYLPIICSNWHFDLLITSGNNWYYKLKRLSVSKIALTFDFLSKLLF